MFVKWQDHVYDFEIMIWNHVSDSGKSNAPYESKNLGVWLHDLLKIGNGTAGGERSQVESIIY